MTVRKRVRHELTTVAGGSWKMRSPEGYGWYYILWAPGLLIIGGDLGDLRLYHYHAMPTLADALPWLARSDVSYLLEKSDKERVLDKDATASDLARFCRECVEVRAKAAQILEKRPTIAAFRAHLDDLGPERTAEFCAWQLGLDDYYGTCSYTPHDRHLIAAIKDWARMMLSAKQHEPQHPDCRCTIAADCRFHTTVRPRPVKEST